MSTFEAYVNVGNVSIAVSAVGAPIRVESKRAAGDGPAAILRVYLPVLSESWMDESAAEGETNQDQASRSQAQALWEDRHGEVET